jgi:hypothetical protein
MSGSRGHNTAKHFTETRLRARAARAGISLGSAFAMSGLLVALVLSSCTNNLSSRSVSSSSITGVGITTNFAMAITGVVEDQGNPSGTLDILGDGSGAMASLCVAGTGVGNSGLGVSPSPTPSPSASSSSSTSSTGTTSGPSTCACNYSYTTSSGVTENVQVDTTYHESNLIACNYGVIPTSATNIQVSVFVTTSDSYSNAVAFSPNGSTSSTSLTLASNYSLVQRYQCKDIVSIPYFMGGALGSGNSIYDPILSEDPSYSYPLNFFTTNLGGTYAEYIQNGVLNWNCPANPNDPNFGNNYTLYSVGPDTAGSYLISPPGGSAFDRSTFYASNTQAGVFTIPLNTYIAPTLLATAVNPNNAPIGYGAAPIPSGTNQESCPDTVNIPTGYHWVKVWLFRANLPDRRFPVSPGVTSLQSVACNPGTWNAAGSADVFTDCAGTCTSNNATQCQDEVVTSSCTGSARGVECETVAATTKLADRVLLGEGTSTGPMCVDMNTPLPIVASGANYFPQIKAPLNYFQPPTAFDFGAGGSCGNPSFPGELDLPYVSIATGTDIWLPKQDQGTGGINSTSLITDSMDLLGKVSGIVAAPKDENLTSVDLDQSGGVQNARYDFVFVVTPPTVMAADMENSSNTTNYPYMPMRFPNASDCLSTDPNFPTGPGDCNPTKLIHYGLKLHDVGTNGDPPANNPNEAGIYPMCALQPN